MKPIIEHNGFLAAMIVVSIALLAGRVWGMVL